MQKAFMGTCVLLLFLTTCSQPRRDLVTPDESTLNTVIVKPQTKQKEIDYGYYLERIQEEVMKSRFVVEQEEEIARMTSEIKEFWVFYYNLDQKCEGCKKAWPIRQRHRDRFDKYSRELAEIVYYFKRVPSKLGGQLPMHEDTHIFLAMMVVKETAVDPTARGKIGEVGLIQIHGEAQQGYTVQEILDDPKLGIFLGVNWVASKFKTCRKNLDYDNWDNKMWYYPITIYAAGEGDGRASRGKCEAIGVARKRVNLTIRFLDSK